MVHYPITNCVHCFGVVAQNAVGSAMRMQDVDRIIATLKASKKKSVETAGVNLDKADLMALCDAAAKIFSRESMLLEITAPMMILGDTHGQFSDLLRLFNLTGWPDNAHTGYLFLGDYVDRGRHGIETFALLIAFKVRYPKQMHLLRGNHECAAITRVYGFYDEVIQRYDANLWEMFCHCFRNMPIAALINGRIFCMHGGLSPQLQDFDQIRGIEKPVETPDVGLLCDLVWADPNKDIPSQWGENLRGLSFSFSAAVVEEFCARFDIDLIVRAHQVVHDGYEFFAGRRLLTIFSAPNYCGQFDNAAAVLEVKQNLECRFLVLRPMLDARMKPVKK